jgi:hypothetical protein
VKKIEESSRGEINRKRERERAQKRKREKKKGGRGAVEKPNYKKTKKKKRSRINVYKDCHSTQLKFLSLISPLFLSDQLLPCH